MKKGLALLLCAVLVCALAACSKAATEKETVPAGETETAQAQTETTEVTTQATASVDNYTLGTLVTVNGNTPFKLNGLRLDGNRSATENNGKDFATENIRAGFWLDERIAFYLDTDYNNPDSEDVKVVCVPHRDITEYAEMTFDAILEEAAFVETFTGQENPEEPCFDPFVFGEDFEEGDYDLLFTYQGNIAYYMVINLTSEQM